MSCVEEQRLMKEYQAAVRAYGKRVIQLLDATNLDATNNDFDEAYTMIEQALNEYRSTRTALIRHKRSHRCSTGITVSA